MDDESRDINLKVILKLRMDMPLFTLFRLVVPYSACDLGILGNRSHKPICTASSARMMGCSTCTPFACAIAPTAKGML